MRADPAQLPRVLVAGVGPLPPEDPERLYAPGVRIWGIARELARAGHAVRLAVARPWGSAIDQLFIYDLLGATPLPRARTLPVEAGRFALALAAEARDFGADAAVGSTDLMNLALARADFRLPLWCDFFGDPMAERQMLARVHESDDGIADQWRALAPALARADRLSGCSRRQAGALAGQMAALGRLNRWTAEERLVARVAPWIEPIEPAPGDEMILRGKAVPAGEALVVQTGGFNSWLDVETLHAALEILMRARADLHFAATGGAIAGHNDRTFARFEALAAASPFRERFHLLGWVPLPTVPHVIAEGDVGLNVDLPCLEGWHGTRNRLLDWAMGSLPIVSTLGCELAEEMADAGWLRPAPQADARAIASAVEETLSNLGDFKRRAAESREKVAARYAPAASLAPLLDWARDPRPAPDVDAWRSGEPRPALALQAEGDAELAAALQSASARARSARARLASMEGSSIVRAAMRLRRGPGRK